MMVLLGAGYRRNRNPFYQIITTWDSRDGTPKEDNLEESYKNVFQVFGKRNSGDSENLNTSIISAMGWDHFMNDLDPEEEEEETLSAPQLKEQDFYHNTVASVRTSIEKLRIIIASADKRKYQIYLECEDFLKMEEGALIEHYPEFKDRKVL